MPFVNLDPQLPPDDAVIILVATEVDCYAIMSKVMAKLIEAHPGSWFQGRPAWSRERN